MRFFKWVLFLIIVVSVSSYTPHAQIFAYPFYSNVSSLWRNSPTGLPFGNEDTIVRPILNKEVSGENLHLLHFSCGFVGHPAGSDFVFAVFVSGSEFGVPTAINPRVVWSANTNTPVKENGTLQLTLDGDLLLHDADGTKIWSSNTSNRSVAGMRITDKGNLVLYDLKNVTVWQSFDHPTNVLLPTQKLDVGQKLVSSNGVYYIALTNSGLAAYVNANPPQMYQKIEAEGTEYAEFTNGDLILYAANGSPLTGMHSILPPFFGQYLKLELDGTLVVYGWNDVAWNSVYDLFLMGVCDSPTVCGHYGICVQEETLCQCPRDNPNDLNFFRPTQENNNTFACTPITPLTCNAKQYHHFLHLQDVFYFGYADDNAPTLKGIDVDNCKKTCMINCSCKAVLFLEVNSPIGNCFLPNELFSLTKFPIAPELNYKSSAFIKVQMPVRMPTPPPIHTAKSIPIGGRKKSTWVMVIFAISIGALFAISILLSFLWRVIGREKESSEEENHTNQVGALPVRFCFKDLAVATDNFRTKIGGGGFGSVFTGILHNGTKVAVKRLDGVGQGRKEFLAEVATIGRIHHYNLVRLVGFCSEKYHRLLVYEYMNNGSLDKWIFHENQNPVLDWETRRRIILDIAKGLSYLHEECLQKIVHLDIKPQNILLDDKFNAKVSDFGSSKVMGRDQGPVLTKLRGTMGYLAPEWLNSRITEKADVYSFGVVLMEIVCGRKNLDYSQPDENVHLLSLLKGREEDDQLFDIVDKQCKDMKRHQKEVAKMVKIAVWCLQGDRSKRPSMTMVVKVLEGAMDVESNLDYNVSSPSSQIANGESHLAISGSIASSVLSGPR